LSATQQIGSIFALAFRIADNLLVDMHRRERRQSDEVDAYNLDQVQGARYTTDRSSFVNVLPSVHVNYDFDRKTKLRAAVWTSFARPDIARMRSARECTYDTDGDGDENATSDWVLLGIQQGNPDLTGCGKRRFP
jgi:outer membrane receptor protein involved in Fe transport